MYGCAGQRQQRSSSATDAHARQQVKEGSAGQQLQAAAYGQPSAQPWRCTAKKGSLPSDLPRQGQHATAPACSCMLALLWEMTD
jgi:hypothetical protein